jgi:enamine deaminase RidA (YjgF/YER057c/UK114 family)
MKAEGKKDGTKEVDGPSARVTIVQPEGWEKPRGYSNGVAVDGPVRWLEIAGQVAWDPDQSLVGGGDFVAQFRQALANVIAVVEAAGGAAAHLVSLTIYIKDKRAYLAEVEALGRVYRELMGKHFPSMALLEVADLLETGALVEIQGRAAIPLGART